MLYIVLHQEISAILHAEPVESRWEQIPSQEQHSQFVYAGTCVCVCVSLILINHEKINSFLEYSEVTMAYPLNIFPIRFSAGSLGLSCIATSPWACAVYRTVGALQWNKHQQTNQQMSANMHTHKFDVYLHIFTMFKQCFTNWSFSSTMPFHHWSAHKWVFQTRHQSYLFG